MTGVPSFEVVWTDINGQYEGLIPDDQFEGRFLLYLLFLFYYPRVSDLRKH